MKNKTNISDNSIDSAGLPKDYKLALAELIWNGFDAKATEVHIRFETNAIDSLSLLTISDNGEGIDYESLKETFGAFLDSRKKNIPQRSSYNRGKKGKGRFAFAAFAHSARWHTVYKRDGKYLEYDILIRSNKKNEYDDENKRISRKRATGTDLILSELHGISAYSFSSEDFLSFLAKEFGWFLFLNRQHHFALKVNDVPLDYAYLIVENDARELKVKYREREAVFTLTYIRWKENIGDKYYYYFLNEERKERAKLLTSHNNNAVAFHHSLFIESSFFDNFQLQEDDPNTTLFGNNHNDPLFKKLMKELAAYLETKHKNFIRETSAFSLLSKFEKEGVLPEFATNGYDQQRKKELIGVVKELYCIQPRIFKGLKREQEQTLLGFLNLLLDTDERENIIAIIENVVRLTATEKQDLKNVLQKTSLSRITNAVKLIENRYKVVTLLQALVFDLSQFTNERDHIQQVIAENYWLFGEQYHLVSADEHFQTLLSRYLNLVDGTVPEKQELSYDWKKRPDIFLCRKRNVPDPADQEYELEQNIMVELKRPSVTITKQEFRQIDDYLDFILKNEQFNSQLRTWKFYVVSNKVDAYIHKQYEAFRDKGKRFLVQQAGNYEIYALTWADLFRTFEIRHNYLLDKLDFDRQAIEEELALKGIQFRKNTPDKLVKSILKKNPEAGTP